MVLVFGILEALLHWRQVIQNRELIQRAIDFMVVQRHYARHLFLVRVMSVVRCLTIRRSRRQIGGFGSAFAVDRMGRRGSAFVVRRTRSHETLQIAD